MTWEKLSEDVFVKREVLITARQKLSVLKQRLAKLQAILKPTDEQLLAWAKRNHPYPVEKKLIQVKAEQELEKLGVEPSDDEYRSWALEFHPYHSVQDSIKTLKDLIETLEAL